KNVVIDQNILVANRENPLWKILQGCLNQSKPIEDLFCALVIIKDKSLADNNFMQIANSSVVKLVELNSFKMLEALISGDNFQPQQSDLKKAANIVCQNIVNQNSGFEIMDKLLDVGAEIELTDFYQASQLLNKSLSGYHRIFVKLINQEAILEKITSLERIANIEGEVRICDSLLITAIENNNTECAEILLKKIAFNESIKVFALDTAFRLGKLEFFKMIDDNSSSSSAIDQGKKMINDSIMSKLNESMKYANQEGNTIFLIAARDGYSNLINLLIRNGAIIDTKNKEGDTALTLAVKNDHDEIVETILREIINEDFTYEDKYKEFISEAKEVAEVRVEKEKEKEKEKGNSAWICALFNIYLGEAELPSTNVSADLNATAKLKENEKGGGLSK
ncbi:MAG: ankyrin repeat domain-containing protein, partial [Rickettsiales bacterium]|nr:ankyrin repeat domain-containing protein [Rickettsiales bacterium]